MNEQRILHDFGGHTFMATQAQIDSASTSETIEMGGRVFPIWGTPYDTAEDKVLWFTQLKRFIKGGWQRNHFTKRLYDGLHVHMFGHIAHYSIHGFYEVWFSGPGERAAWVQYAASGGTFGFHDYARKDMWGDIEQLTALWLAESGVYIATLKAADEKVRSDDLALLTSLRAKYPEA